MSNQHFYKFRPVSYTHLLRSVCICSYSVATEGPREHDEDVDLNYAPIFMFIAFIYCIYKRIILLLEE